MTLFLDHGFDAVSTKQVADAADVSPTTVFAHFPQKEALVFDEDDQQREWLLAAVRDRPTGVTVTQALHSHFRKLLVAHPHSENIRRFQALIGATPSLAQYAERMWVRHGDDLAEELATEAGLDEPTEEIAAFARFAVQIRILASESSDPADMLEAGFRILEGGWAGYAKHIGLGT